jgi:uncharacterized membrane protein YkvA (DUF1232 family)
LAWRLLRDERVNALKYVLPAIVTLYLISPIDGIPDFLIGPGQVDDVGFVIGAVLLLARVLPWLAPRDVVDEHVMDLAGVHVEWEGSAAEQVVEARFSVRTS